MTPKPLTPAEWQALSAKVRMVAMQARAARLECESFQERIVEAALKRGITEGLAGWLLCLFARVRAGNL